MFNFLCKAQGEGERVCRMDFADVLNKPVRGRAKGE